MEGQDPTLWLTDQEQADFWLNRRHKKLPYIGHRLVFRLVADPSPTFRTPTATFPIVARELAGAERVAAWERVVRFNPIYEAFQACTERTIAVVALERRRNTV